MVYVWYNNGKENIRINGKPPQGFVKGYILRNKMSRLKKMTSSYNKRIEAIKEKYKNIAKNKIEKLEKELLIKQKKLTDF